MSPTVRGLGTPGRPPTRPSRSPVVEADRQPEVGDHPHGEDSQQARPARYSARGRPAGRHRGSRHEISHRVSLPPDHGSSRLLIPRQALGYLGRDGTVTSPRPTARAGRPQLALREKLLIENVSAALFVDTSSTP